MTSMKEQRDARVSYWIALGLALLMAVDLLYDLVMMVVNHGIKHPVAVFLGEHADQGRVPFAGLESGAFWLLISGQLLIVVGLILMAFMVAGMGRQIVKGAIFSDSSLRIFRLILVGLCGYFLGLYIQRMGANWVAAQFDALQWFDLNLSGVYSEYLTCLFLLCMVFLSVGVSRGIKLQADQEGLI